MIKLIKKENKTTRYVNKVIGTETETYEVCGYDELIEFIKQQKEKKTRITEFNVNTKEIYECDRPHFPALYIDTYTIKCEKITKQNIVIDGIEFVDIEPIEQGENDNGNYKI